jgi:hypothetical protein
MQRRAHRVDGMYEEKVIWPTFRTVGPIKYKELARRLRCGVLRGELLNIRQSLWSLPMLCMCVHAVDFFFACLVRDTSPGAIFRANKGRLELKTVRDEIGFGLVGWEYYSS